VFAIEVSAQLMIAHSFRGDVFGPAQRLHGATFVVRAAFLAETLDRNGIVADIGCAQRLLNTALDPLNFRNLDELQQFKNVNTTTEYVAKHVFDRLAAATRAGELGRAAGEIKAIRVTVAESPSARAWYEAPV
jgi:6-pyruvoyl-tetrahydropterin synthase